MLAGEIDSHIVCAHLRVEQFCIAVFRNLRCNPVRRLLEPHLKEVLVFNAMGDSVVWGDAGIISQGTCMKAAPMAARMRRLCAGSDWSRFKPRVPRCDGHRFARAANLYWSLLTEYVGRFFAQDQEEIVRHWNEILRLS